MSDSLQAIKQEVKDMKPHIETKDVKHEVIKKVVPTSLEAKQRAEHARKSAHKITADLKRETSMEIKNKLSESFDFIEESCGSGEPTFEFYEEPTMVSEGLEDGAPSYPIIGKATGVFAPIGVMSRNNRIYDNDHYDYLLDNQQLVDRISHRGMLGTIGHHDKKVDDVDLADGKVSHIVTNLRIVEEADGSRNLYGTLEILDTPAGHLLKTYYDSGVPLFVSSRGGGNLLPVPNESYKRVDKTKYFLETFDIVKNPGFLQAKPVYEKVSESAEDVVAVEEPKEEIVESVDKIDKLADTLAKFVEVITEAKKEDKKDEDKNKPEDEKNDDEEDAVAGSVTEEKDYEAEAQKSVDKICDPTKGLTDKEIAQGYRQTNFLSAQDQTNLKDSHMQNAKARDDRATSISTAQPVKAPETKAVQLDIFGNVKGTNESKEAIANVFEAVKEHAKDKRKEDIKKALKADIKAQGVGEVSANLQKPAELKEPIACDRQEIARALKAGIKGDNK